MCGWAPFGAYAGVLICLLILIVRFYVKRK